MTKKEHEEFEELITSKMNEVRYGGVIAGFKAAYRSIVEMIDNGMSLEDIKKWAKSEEEKAEIVEEVTVSNK